MPNEGQSDAAAGGRSPADQNVEPSFQQAILTRIVMDEFERGFLREFRYVVAEAVRTDSDAESLENFGRYLARKAGMTRESSAPFALSTTFSQSRAWPISWTAHSTLGKRPCIRSPRPRWSCGTHSSEMKLHGSVRIGYKRCRSATRATLQVSLGSTLAILLTLRSSRQQQSAGKIDRDQRLSLRC
jgi:hypothetical protein